MKKKWFYTLIGILICIASFYVLRNFVGKPGKIEDVFTIYYVDGLNLDESLAIDINKIPLEEEPALSEKDIDIYVWKHHIIELAKDSEAKKRLSDFTIKGHKLLQPFVLICNDERIYVGAFVSALSSYLPPCPTITYGLEQSSLRIGQLTQDDIRSDNRIYKALKSIGKIQ